MKRTLSVNFSDRVTQRHDQDRGRGKQPASSRNNAFTLTELCAVLAGACLLLAIAWPTMAGSKGRAERLMCVSNLEDLGKGYNLWASDHGDVYPFLLSASAGGIRTPYGGLEMYSWFQYSWISNELRTARVLVCPSDTSKRPVDDFSFGSRGLLAPNNRNNCVSYFLAYPNQPVGHSVLAGDRNLTVSPASQCNVFGPVGVSAIITSAGYPQTSWTTSIHQSSGNLLLRDGSVEQADTASLRKYVDVGDDANVFHLLLP